MFAAGLHTVSTQPNLTIMALLQLAAAGIFAYPFIILFYNIFLHPLRRFPGPLLFRLSVLPKYYYLSRGDLVHKVRELHQIYGPVLRLAPNELAFTDGAAWKEIYGRKASENKYEMPRDESFYNPFELAPSIISAGREEHDMIRKLLGPSFSDKSIKAQEHHVGRYVDLLVDKLSEQIKEKKDGVVNMTDWLAFCTFDLIGNLAFGSDFNCLESGTYHPWIATIINGLREFTAISVLSSVGAMFIIRFLLFQLGLGQENFRKQRAFTVDKTAKRLEMGTDRDDFLDNLIKADIPKESLYENASLLVVAGSETSATLLTGALYLLAMNPDTLKRLQEEVRDTFQDEKDITLSSVNNLEYMLAVIKESLRMYPPAASALPRIVPAGGAEIAGHRIPEGTVVSIFQWAVNYDEGHFYEPYKFDPLRCFQRAKTNKNTDDGSTESDSKDDDANTVPKEYAHDNLDVLNPFLVGPRNCIGQALAYAEMRLILARLIWKFDMELCDDSKEWLKDQKNYVLWEKPALHMRLVERAV